MFRMHTKRRRRYLCRKFPLLAAGIHVLCTAVVIAQPTRNPWDDAAVGGKTTAESLQSLMSGVSGVQFPVESAVDPATYFVGPGDQYVLSIPLLSDTPIPVIISYDNIALLPRGISIPVAQRTLASFRAAVDSAYESRQGKYANLVLALIKPRTIQVTVAGCVASPGTYMLTSAHRVSGAIGAANNMLATAATAKLNAIQNMLAGNTLEARDTVGLGNVASRKLLPRFVTVQHQNGTVQQVDLVRCRATDEPLQNPHLREGDMIVVHQPEPGAPSVAALGAVNIPMAIPYAPGDNVLMLMRLAAWMREDADSGAVFLHHQGDSASGAIRLDPRDTIAMMARALRPGDVIIVAPRTKDARAAVGAVAVVGEVVNPSVQSIVPGRTTVSEVLRAVGGVTGGAMPEGAFIMRAAEPEGYAKSEVLEKVQISTRMDSLRLLQGRDQQRIAVNLKRLLDDGDRSQDVVLEGGDRIVVPREREGVVVRGQVRRSGWIAFHDGADADYYVNAAGGFAAFSDKSHVLLRSSGSDGWVLAGDAKPGPGDEIYVPIDPPVPPRTSLETANTFVSITGALVSITLAILYFVRSKN